MQLRQQELPLTFTDVSDVVGKEQQTFDVMAVCPTRTDCSLVTKR